MYIPKQYLIALALVGAIAFGFVSRLITDQIGSAHASNRQQGPAVVQAAPGAAGSPAVAGTSYDQPAASPAVPAAPAPIVTQPGSGGGSTTNIYLTIVNTPGGATTVPPSVNVVPAP